MIEGKSLRDLQLLVTEAGRALDLLAVHSGLAKTRLKDAMVKGAVWLRKGGGKMRRLRRATTELKPGDTLRLCYDEKTLAVPVPAPVLLADHLTFSVWFKPAGLLSQGTDFGDFCSLPRQVELYFKLKRKVFLVHRLDREVSGLVVLAHDRPTAGRLGKKFAERLVAKSYLAGVMGRIDPGAIMFFGQDLDGRPASTRCRGLAYDAERKESLVLVQPETGRLHQIRRHLADNATPIVGDSRYGRKTGSPMRLCAIRLQLKSDQGKGGGLDLRLPAQFLPVWAAEAGSRSETWL